jgi:predicted MFS family arabinose efflux permease
MANVQPGASRLQPWPVPAYSPKMTKKSSRAVAVICLLALGVDSIAIRSMSLLAPLIRTSLHLDDGQFGFIFSALTAGTLISAIPAAALLNRLRPNRAFGAIMAIMGVALFFVAWQTSFIGLIAALFFVGLVRTGIIPMVNRVITEQVDATQRGARMGVIYAAVPFGGMVGALVLPAVAQLLGWSAGYYLLGSIALLGGLVAWKLAPKDSASRSSSRLALGLSTTIRSGTFIILAATYGLFALSMTADAFVTLYLVDVVKISAFIAGSLFGLIQLTGVGGRVFWGILADRYFSKNRWWLLAATSWLLVVAFTLLTRLNPTSAWWMVAAVMIAIGMSSTSSWGILSTLMGDVVGIESVAIATATVFFVTNITDVGGPLLFSSIHKLAGSYQTPLSFFIGFAALSACTFTWMAMHKQSKASVA